MVIEYASLGCSMKDSGQMIFIEVTQSFCILFLSFAIHHEMTSQIALSVCSLIVCHWSSRNNITRKQYKNANNKPLFERFVNILELF